MDANTTSVDGLQAEPLKPHAAAEIFPEMASPDFERLVDDIKKNGQLEPIVTYNGAVLDGRHRYKACLQIGIEPKTIEWSGIGTVEDFVISKNLHRRHLNESQRAMVAAKIAICQHGGDRRSDQAANLPLGFSQKKAAEKVNVSERSVRTAVTVIAKGDPALVAAVERGAIKVSAAGELVDLPKDRQRELATAGKYAVAKSVKTVRRNEAKRRRARADRADQEKPKAESDVRQAPDFQAEAAANARDLEIERDERIALIGESELATENEQLKRQNAMLDRRIAALGEEAASLRTKVEFHKRMAQEWEKRARAAGWKPSADV